MRWMKKFQRNLPVVPDDRAEREVAKVESQDRLHQAIVKHEEVKPLVEALRQEGATNHYIERLRSAYGVL